MPIRSPYSRKWQATKAIQCWCSGCRSQARVYIVSFSFHNLHEWDRQVQLNQWVCHDWTVEYCQDPTFDVRRWLGFVFFHWITSPTNINISKQINIVPGQQSGKFAQLQRRLCLVWKIWKHFLVHRRPSSGF